MSSTPEGQGKSELEFEVDTIVDTGSTRGRIRMAAYVIGTHVATFDDREHKLHEELFKQEPAPVPPEITYGFSLRAFGLTNASFTMFQSLGEPEHDPKPHDELNETDESISDFDAAQIAFKKAQLALRASMDGAQAVYGLSHRQIEKAKRLSRKLS